MYLRRVLLLELLKRTRLHLRLIGRQVRKPRARVRKPQLPRALEQEYFTWLRGTVRGARAELVRRVLPLLADAVAQARKANDRADTAEPVLTELDGLLLTLERGILSPAVLEQRIRAWGRRIAVYQGSELQASIRAALGIETPLTSDAQLGPILRNWITENVRLIRTMHRQTFSTVETMVVQGVNSGRRHEEIAADLVERFGIAERRAALIARDQVGKFYGQVQRARQKELGITRYVWRTSMDERVREEHAEREGEVFEWSEPPDDGHPGFPINCRCTAEPDLNQLLEQLEADEAAEREEIARASAA